MLKASPSLDMEEEHADDLVSLLEEFGNWYRLAEVLRRFEHRKVNEITVVNRCSKDG
jgi:hypothetical protein